MLKLLRAGGLAASSRGALDGSTGETIKGESRFCAVVRVGRVVGMLIADFVQGGSVTPGFKNPFLFKRKNFEAMI